MTDPTPEELDAIDRELRDMTGAEQLRMVFDLRERAERAEAALARVREGLTEVDRRLTQVVNYCEGSEPCLFAIKNTVSAIATRARDLLAALEEMKGPLCDICGKHEACTGKNGYGVCSEACSWAAQDRAPFDPEGGDRG